MKFNAVGKKVQFKNMAGAVAFAFAVFLRFFFWKREKRRKKERKKEEKREKGKKKREKIFKIFFFSLFQPESLKSFDQVKILKDMFARTPLMRFYFRFFFMRKEFLKCFLFLFSFFFYSNKKCLTNKNLIFNN